LHNEKMDVICANLPYVPSAHIDGLAADIRQFEPRPALDGGADGLALIRKLVAASPQYLNSGGWLVLEVGDGQASMVCDLYTRVGLVQVHTLSDLAGVIRVVAGMQPLDT
jgi:release factor glutamine methyltransferase